MRILYITPELPFPLTSGFLRHYFFIRGLSERHSVTLFSPTCRPQTCDEGIRELRRFAQRVEVFPDWRDNKNTHDGRRIGALNALTAQKFLRRRAVIRMRAAVREFVRQRPCDLVLFSGKSNIPVLQATAGVPLLIDCCDAAHLRHLWEARNCPFPRNCWSYMRYLQARGVERTISARTGYLLFASERDQVAITGGTNRGYVVPNGVDLHYWNSSGRAEEQHTIVFSGVMSYRPNHDAAMFLIREVLPLVQRTERGTRVCIVGRDALPELRCEASRHTGLTVTGCVPDMRPYLAIGSVYVAPIRYASGIQNKLLEAMAMRIPVVTTEVAASGLRASTVVPPVLVAERAADIAEKTVLLMRSQEERRRLGEQGRLFVEEHFNWPTILKRLEFVCMEAACQYQTAAVEAA